MNKYWEITDEGINPKNLKVINEFLLSQKLANKAIGTIMEYRWTLIRFFKDFPKAIDEMIPDDVLTWLNTHYGDKKKSTRVNCTSRLAFFFKFCNLEGYTDKSLVKIRWKPRLPKPMPKYLDRKEVAKVKVAAERLCVRKRALIEFMLSSGSRVGEVHRLNVIDLDFSNRIAKVIGKGGKIRHVHFSETCAMLLKKYLEERTTNHEAAFLDEFGRRIGIRAVQRIVKKLGEDAGLDRVISPHCFRHTFATNLLTRGAELEFISEELGHANLNTTRIYARLPSEQVVTLYKRYMG